MLIWFFKWGLTNSGDSVNTSLTSTTVPETGELISLSKTHLLSKTHTFKKNNIRFNKRERNQRNETERKEWDWVSPEENPRWATEVLRWEATLEAHKKLAAIVFVRSLNDTQQQWERERVNSPIGWLLIFLWQKGLVGCIFANRISLPESFTRGPTYPLKATLWVVTFDHIL